MTGAERTPWPTSSQSNRQRWPLVAVVPVSIGLVLAAILPFETRVFAAQRAALGHAGGASAAGHRAAVVDRMYSSVLAVDYLRSLQLLDPERLPPFTIEAQGWLWRRQNPPPSRCGSAQYLLGFVATDQGLGSAMHLATVHLATAMQHDRLFLWAPNTNRTPITEDRKWWRPFIAPHLQHYNEIPSSGEGFVDEGCGGANRDDGFECIFAPLSSTCSTADADEGNSVYHPRLPSFNQSGDIGPVPWTIARGPSYWDDRLKQHYIQRGVNVTGAYLRYWWRTQGIAYVMRPNVHAAESLRRLRHDASIQEVFYSGVRQLGVPMPYPLPEGTVSLHIRHGDKAREMTLLSLTAYGQAAEKLTMHNPLTFKRAAFVSSEDPEVIRDAQNLTTFGVDGTAPDEGYVIYTSGIARANTGPHEQIRLFGRSNMTMIWLLQLWMAVECDAWVGQRNSNWNRLIDEMRCVLVDKCDHVFIEMGEHKEWGGYKTW